MRRRATRDPAVARPETVRADSARMQEPTRYRCPICRCTTYEIVTVRTPRGETRRTPFFACNGCSAMFTDPVAFTHFDPQRVTARHGPARVRS